MVEGFVEKNSKGVWTAKSVDTPSSSDEVASSAVLSQLEFYETVERVARGALTAPGAAMVRDRIPLPDLELIAEELELVDELVQLYLGAGSVALERVEDISPSLLKLDVDGSVLDPLELLEVARGLESIERLVRSVEAERERLPLLRGGLQGMPARGPARSIVDAIQEDGTVRDEASDELLRVRRRLRERRAALIRLLERKAGELERHQDDTVAYRNGRYVLAVRSDLRSRCSGIIHGQSASGQTLYLEPSEAVEAGNELIELEAQGKREELKVLRGLTEQLRAKREGIQDGWRFYVVADSLLARARFAIEHGARKPALNRSGILKIVQAHHPLLDGAGGAVVPFDLELLPAVRVLVVSGPNAGGKTVLLKAIGQIAALTQAGFIPPVTMDTSLPVFTRIFCDIGDHQSIAANLSTFSAHLERTRTITDEADGGSLVLLDEIGSGTDPREGTALAAAVLGSLAARGSRTIATTHLNQLKHLATENDAIQNASLEFDEGTLTPTYRLIEGIPGRSYGLVMARRVGLAEAIIRQAESTLPEAEKSVDALLGELEEERMRLEEERLQFEQSSEAVERTRAELEERQQALDELGVELHERKAELERSGRKEARRFLLEARKRVEEALGLARAAVDEATARQARKMVEEGVAEEARAMEELLKAGRARGWKVVGPQAVKPSKQHIPAIEAEPEVNIRGLRIEEARSRLIDALDAAVVQDLPALRIVHGKGTGALKTLVHETLRADRRVASRRLAQATEGGAGVTIAELVR